MRLSIALPSILIVFLAIGVADKAKVVEGLVGLVSAAEAMGHAGLVLYVVIFVLATFVFVPTAPLDMAAGLLFSKKYTVYVASLLAIIGKQASGAAAFLLGRTLLRRYVTEKILPRFPVVGALSKSMEKDAFRMACMIRFVPMPTMAKSLCVAVSGIPFGHFLAASTLFAVPWTIAGVLVGATLTSLPELFDGSGEEKIREMFDAWKSRPGLTTIGFVTLAGVAVYVGHKFLEIRLLYKEIVASKAGANGDSDKAASGGPPGNAKVMDAGARMR